MPAVVTIIGDDTDTRLAHRAHYAGEQFDMVLKVQDRNGDARDISDADLEMTLTDGDNTIEKEPSDFVCPHDGINSQCSMTVTSDDTEDAGTYNGQLIITDGASITKSNQLTLMLMSGNCPLTLGDIRLSLMDTPELNDYMEEREISDELLALARKRAIDQWNSRAGDHAQYTVDTFPTDQHGLEKWRLGAMAQALQMKVTGLLRNRVQIQGEGMAADEKGPRAEAYQKIAAKWEEQWELFIAKQQWADTHGNAWRTI